MQRREYPTRKSSDDDDEEEEEEEKVRRHRSQDISSYTQFDESIEVRNAEEVKSPASDRKPQQTDNNIRISTQRPEGKSESRRDIDLRSPASRAADFRRYSVPEDSFNKSMGLDSESSDSEDSEELDVQKLARMKLGDFYDSKQFEDLDVSSEVKELFQNISRYTPQKIELQYKLIPLIPDYIPAVGDIDAFLKLPRPDGAPDQLGLVVLDEPAADQSEPAVLHLQLRSRSRSAAGASKASVVKRLEDASRQGRSIDKWIDDMGQLHRSQHPPAVQLSNRFPNADLLLEPWSPEIEDKLGLLRPAELLQIDCPLLEFIDVICALLDVPVYSDARIESLHTIFALYTEIHNIDIQKIHV